MVERIQRRRKLSAWPFANAQETTKGAHVHLLLILLPSTTFAQQIDGDALLITTTSSSGYGVITSSLAVTEVKKYMRIEQNIRMYKQQNNTAIQSALRLGGGVAVTDMAKILGLDASQTKVFGKRLRADRKALSVLSDDQFAKAVCKYSIESKIKS